MTPEPTEPEQKPEGGFALDINHYVAALERKNAQLLRENTALDAVVAQISEERDKAIAAMDQLATNQATPIADKPQHNGRVTAPKPKANTGKKAH